jgi:hypothetical protein
MEDAKRPGWGNGILGDCGSLDPGSIPGPGPMTRPNENHSETNLAPQLGQMSSLSVTGFPHDGHS